MSRRYGYLVTPGQQLKRLRSDANLKQDDVADAMKVHPTAVSHWETDRTKPTRANAEALDELLGTDGAVMRLFGYSTTYDDVISLPGVVGELQALVLGLKETVADQATRLAAMDARLVKLEGGRSSRGGRASG